MDLGRATVKVCQRADAWCAIDLPKSEAGHRTVPLPPLVVKALREWKLACPKGVLGLVFPSGTGEVGSHSNILQRHRCSSRQA